MRIPQSLSTRVLGSAASSFDRALVRAVAWGRRSRAEGLPHAERIEKLGLVRDAYGDPRFLTTPDLFFQPPAPIHPLCVRVRDLDDNDQQSGVFDASWPSGFTPHLKEFGERYLSQKDNRTAQARLYLSGKPRPAVIAIHGYMTGQYNFEERAFPVRWMLRRGFDVALFTLPFHALRSGGRRGPPSFPGADPRFTIEGFRQSMHDLRGLIAYLRGRGAPAVGVMGMSLGGYTTALLATVEASLAFAIPIIPVASFADFARERGRLGEAGEVAAQHDAFEDAVRVVSPLARPSRVEGRRTLILGASHDQITPLQHAERIAAHTGGRLVVFTGGHLLQFGRGEAFREVGRFWRGLGLG